MILPLGTRVGPYVVVYRGVSSDIVRDPTGTELRAFARISNNTPIANDDLIAEIERWRALGEPEISIVHVGSFEADGDTGVAVVHDLTSRSRTLREQRMRSRLTIDDAREIGRRVAKVLARAEDAGMSVLHLSSDELWVEPDDRDDKIRLTDLPTSHVPDVAVRSLGGLLFELVAGNDDPGRATLDALIAQTYKAQPPTMREMVLALGAPRPLAITRTEYHPSDETEQRLLDELLAADDDSVPREIYADWLEEHGRLAYATFLRREHEVDDSDRVALTPGVDVPWRRLVSGPPIARCVTFGNGCTERWDAMTRTSVDEVRHCETCRRSIFYCESLEEAAYRGRRGDCIAIDATLVTASATGVYDDARKPIPEMWVGEVAVDPEPEPES